MTELKNSEGYVWFNGAIVPSADAQVHVLTHALHYGYGIFEGTRAYVQKSGETAVFRLDEHLKRLGRSARILAMDMPYDREALHRASLDLLEAHPELDSCYLRHLMFLGAGSMGLYPRNNPVQTVITVWAWGAYLGEEALEKGIRASVSSFTRPFPNSSMSKAKATGSYINSILAKKEAIGQGYDEAVLLDTQGFVAEGSGENLFIVIDGKIKTPPLHAILGGITRDSVIQLALDDGMHVEESTITRDEMYSADEMFFTGTAAEITPVREVDDRPIGLGRPGDVTRRIQERFFAATRGELPAYEHWLTPVKRAAVSDPEAATVTT